MDTNRLSDTLAASLNTQMSKEAQASQIFLAYASWAENKGYIGIANFLFRHSAEEHNHMMIILEYILKRGAEVHISEIPAPPPNPNNLNNCFERVFEQEVENTKGVYEIVRMCNEEKDWATLNFMQWFVKEQVEEETLAMSLIDKFKIAGGDKASFEALYTLDKELGKETDDELSGIKINLEKPNIVYKEQQ